MKYLISVMLFCIFIPLIACDSNNAKAKFIITTTVPIKQGQVNQVLELFKETNPELIKDQADWIKAVFSKNDKKNTVMVHAYWKNKTSYIKFSESDRFQETMKAFGKFFNGKPDIEINEILYQM